MFSCCLGHKNSVLLDFHSLTCSFQLSWNDWLISQCFYHDTGVNKYFLWLWWLFLWLLPWCFCNSALTVFSRGWVASKSNAYEGHTDSIIVRNRPRLRQSGLSYSLTVFITFENSMHLSQPARLSTCLESRLSLVCQLKEFFQLYLFQAASYRIYVFLKATFCVGIFLLILTVILNPFVVVIVSATKLIWTVVRV